MFSADFPVLHPFREEPDIQDRLCDEQIGFPHTLA
jgi:hypothetical protein